MNKKVTFPVWIFISIAGILVVTGIAWGLISRANERKTQEATISTIIETTAAEKTTEPATPTPTQEPTATTTVTETTPETTTAETTPTPKPITPKPTKAPTVSPTPKPATPTPTIPETTVAEAWMEARATSEVYDGAMQERADNGYESIPRNSTLDSLAQGRAEELAILGEINHNNMPNEANWEGLISGGGIYGATLYRHCGDSYAATTIGIGRATYHRADGSRYTVTCMLLKE